MKTGYVDEPNFVSGYYWHLYSYVSKEDFETYLSNCEYDDGDEGFRTLKEIKTTLL
jgi:hypothetical protein